MNYKKRHHPFRVIGGQVKVLTLSSLILFHYICQYSTLQSLSIDLVAMIKYRTLSTRPVISLSNSQPVNTFKCIYLDVHNAVYFNIIFLKECLKS